MKIVIQQSAFRNVSNVNAKTMNTKETFKNESPFVRVGTTLYKIVNQPRLNGGHIKKRIVWNNETLRQDYGKDY